MRIRQLARKLKIKDDEIRSLLAEKLNAQVAEGPNARLEDQHVRLIMDTFAPETKETATTGSGTIRTKNEEAMFVPEPMVDEVVVSDPLENALPEMAKEELPHVDSDGEIPDPDVSVETPKTKAHPTTVENTRDTKGNDEEVIKAPIVELPGPKVVGKIDLPKPEVRELPQVEIDGVMYDRKPRGSQRKPKKNPYKPRARSDRFTPRKQHTEKPEEADNHFLSQEELAHLEEKRREEEKHREKYRKEKKKQYYQQKYRPEKQVKKKVQREEVQAQQKHPQKKEAPKSFFGKIWHWFNT